MLASVAEQASLSPTWSETPEDTFSHDIYDLLIHGSIACAVLFIVFIQHCISQFLFIGQGVSLTSSLY